ncbi:baculoviral IAP repeat-containing protein 7-B isoform X2 [Periplaneta americana]|uniref:baculoviral IAP repeat-containing protein 7-B isoform X2 n=1 Tax=Periplaneta americana TaxID=6978 RepID=UPI0037E90563
MSRWTGGEPTSEVSRSRLFDPEDGKITRNLKKEGSELKLVGSILFSSEMAPDGIKPNPSTHLATMNADNLHKQMSMDTVDSPPQERTPVTSPSPIPSTSDVGPSAHPQITFNLKREMDRRKTYEKWPVAFMDPNRLSAAGFYYKNLEDIVRCAFCGVEVGRWEQGDDPFRDHQRWSPSCGFVRGLPVGNIPINAEGGQPEPSPGEVRRSYDVCGPYLELRPNSGPERGMSNGVHHGLMMTAEEMQKHGINQTRGPMHPTYNTKEARLKSYESWPRSLKQKPEILSDAGFYYTGKGDQTVCFHCGGGLKDWEETDDPWVEHAAWFPKCIHLVLIKGREFIEKVQSLKEKKIPVQEYIDLLEEGQKSKASSSSSSSNTEEEVASSQKEKSDVSDEKVIDDARLCQICFTEERGVLFLPCGHLVACVKCAPSLSICAVCRQPFTGTVRAFLS